jgi:hypothetical protein
MMQIGSMVRLNVGAVARAKRIQEFEKTTSMWMTVWFLVTNSVRLETPRQIRHAL